MFYVLHRSDEVFMYLKRIFFGFLCLFTAVLHAEELLDKVVAVVNQQIITASEAQTQMQKIKEQSLAQHQNVPDEKILKKQVLNHLITEHLQLQLAKQQGMEVDKHELNEAISRIAENNHLTLDAMKEALSHQGQSWTDYQALIQKEMLIARLQQRVLASEIKVSDEQVAQYLKNNRASDQGAWLYSVQNLLIPLSEAPSSEALQKAQALALDLKKQAQKRDFSDLAQTEATLDFLLESSDLGARHLAELPEIFVTALKSMKEGDISEPLRAANGFQLIRLLKIDKSSDKPLTKEQVLLLLQQRKFNDAVTAWQARLRADAYVQILDKDWS